MSSTLAPLDPAKTSTVSSFRVRFAETDLMGIVHHANYLVYFEAGRVEWLRNRGVSFENWAEEGVHVALVEANVQYKSPAKFDDLLAIETTLVELRSVSMKFSYMIRCGERVVAEGLTRLGCVDRNQRLVRVPEKMREVLLTGERSTC